MKLLKIRKKKNNDIKNINCKSYYSDLVPKEYTVDEYIINASNYLTKLIKDYIKNTNVDEDNETFLDETNKEALKYLHLSLKNEQINHESLIKLINIKKQNEILKNSQEIELLEEELDKIQKELRGEERNG
ncbi:hypothetical protein [Thomasclavelia cocleata]|uniref:hypothetical protein n=1 Tax=Thomasclavelia cocleata TaxID=69824 RepID=UPI002430BCC7|nr:hypothetical protein [Thomasclavelia cocleata]